MAQLPEVRLVLVGDGERRPDLEGPRQQLAVADRVEFAGWKDDACPYIAGFDVFVLPSHDESFPLTIVEAMQFARARRWSPRTSAACPTRSPTARRGFSRLPPGDVAAVRVAVNRILEDPQLRRAVTEAAFGSRSAAVHSRNDGVPLRLPVDRGADLISGHRRP